MVNTLFNPRVAAKIYKIIVCPKQHDYKWVWTEEKNSNFSVMSDYRLIHNLKRQPLMESSNIQTLYALWMMYWKM